MSEISTVAIAGASGTLGPHVLKALVDAGFQVTVLTRGKPGTYDSSIKVLEVDYTSLKSLTAALKGIDAVVSTVGGEAIESQIILIDAAVAAGVKRFIPSEFGSVSTNPKLEGFPLYSSMAKIRKHLQQKAAAGELTWTVLVCGAFLDFLLNTPILLNFANHSVTLMDEGDNRISTTSLPKVGTAIAAILKNFDATKDKIVHTSEAILTQNQLLEFAKEINSEIKWEVSKVQSSVLLTESLEQFGVGDHSMPVIMKLLKATALAGDTYGGAYDVTDNKLLGIKELTAEELKKLVAEKLTEK
ncbi:hypothetical protein BGW36DRAFT_370086 [Talaromyces proteolyticus]|uniref:NmrA-like domain-containing protein n=1 Tax=Talaromyces proteolyticus TaxID=1131652 RepID=A0AAD4KYE7_9EURO|nr:uncharacterized protein BGW36DRAFT_370086 [Talaromyces proteolyticus]KAH8703841.1 hypothetical protein BGW36DRAFT_370086 [Talaromyces proteolyticus]